jgi:hypothetical protein
LTGNDGAMAGAELSGWFDDVAAGDWIAARLHPFVQDTGSVIPEGFDAYARLFHPIGDDGRWADMAASNHRIAHPEMQLHQISAPAGEPARAWNDRSLSVSWGSLPIEPRRALVEILTPATTTPDRCWFAVWEGFADVDHGGVAARVALPGRSYLFASGPVEAGSTLLSGASFDQSPNLWWPDDRAWFVATEIDYAWTYVGGSEATIAAVLADDRLEALPARLTDLPFADADTINAALDG